MEVCKLLLKSVKDKNPRDDSGLTPLHMAANKGYLEICKLLMKGLSNKNPASDDGQHTPLHFASDRINWSFIRDVSILGKGRMRAHPATQGLLIQAA